jgi:hypothetical protein
MSFGCSKAVNEKARWESHRAFLFVFLTYQNAARSIGK